MVLNILSCTIYIVSIHFNESVHYNTTSKTLLQGNYNQKYDMKKKTEPGIVARLRNSLDNESTCALLGICDQMYESKIIQQNLNQVLILKRLHTRIIYAL